MMMFHNFDLRLPPPILLAGGIVFSLVFYGFVLVIYRLYLSPIAGVPGPKLAAATQWYEHYYDLIKDGQWSFKVRELHSQYGMWDPIIHTIFLRRLNNVATDTVRNL